MVCKSLHIREILTVKNYTNISQIVANSFPHQDIDLGAIHWGNTLNNYVGWDSVNTSIVGKY